MSTVSLSYPHTNSYERTLNEWLSQAGITINGKSEGDIQVNDARFFKYVLAHGSLGLGESYMLHWWDCRRLDVFFTKILSARLDDHVKRSFSSLLSVLRAKFLNLQSRGKAQHNVVHHYDLGNDLFTFMLDRRLTYTCAYWKDSQTLDQAQEAKLDLTCRKLQLEPGMHVLDVGCGWGSFAGYAAEKYKVKVTGITLSREQLMLGKALYKNLPVELRLMDYRNLTGQFDRIVSLGMFEHVGPKNYSSYFNIVNKCLKPGGIFLLHTIGTSGHVSSNDPWISTYIFPNAVIPDLASIMNSSADLVMEDVHNFGPDYDKTLMAWHENFVRNWNIIRHDYDERFYRMWRYFLLSCAGSFRARKNHLWQIVFTKGRKERYTAVR